MSEFAVPVGQMQGRNRRPTEVGRGFLTPQMACCYKKYPSRWVLHSTSAQSQVIQLRNSGYTPSSVTR